MLFLWICRAAAQIPCATSIDPVPSAKSRIVGGQPAPGVFPWQIYFGPQGGCAGTIIDANRVLTAAHCPQVQSVVAGATKLGDKGPNVQTVRVASMKKHPVWQNTNSPADIAILHLASNFTWTDFVKPACLSKTTPPSGASVRTSGFGLRSASSQLASNQPLYYVDTTVGSCTQGLGSTDGTYVCAGGAGRGSCMGDSGGPTVHLANGQVEVVGVVSHGSSRCDSATAYTNVAHYLDWVKTNSGVEPSDPTPPTTIPPTTIPPTTTPPTTTLPSNPNPSNTNPPSNPNPSEPNPSNPNPLKEYLTTPLLVVIALIFVCVVIYCCYRSKSSGSPQQYVKQRRRRRRRYRGDTRHTRHRSSGHTAARHRSSTPSKRKR